MRFYEFSQNTNEAIPTVGQVGKVVSSAVGRVGKAMGNAVKSATNAANPPKTAQEKAAQKVAQKTNTMAANKLLKPGAKLNIGDQETVVDKVAGNEITIADPKNKKGPKIVYQKDSDQIKGAVQQLIQK